MPDSANDDVVQSFIRHAVDLEKFKSGERNRALKLLKDLEDDVVALLARNSGSQWSKARLRALLIQVRETIATAYGDIQDKITKDLEAAAAIEADFVVDAINGAIGVDVITVEFGAAQLKASVSDALIEGEPQAEWWSRQAKKTENMFADTVRKGIVSGDTLDDMVSTLRKGPFQGTLRRNVEALVRTSTASVMDEARDIVFHQNLDVISELQQHSTLDARTTQICMAYSGKRWKADTYEPVGHNLPYRDGCPRHWGCRGVIVPGPAGILAIRGSGREERCAARAASVHRQTARPRDGRIRYPSSDARRPGLDGRLRSEGYGLRIVAGDETGGVPKRSAWAW